MLICQPNAGQVVSLPARFASQPTRRQAHTQADCEAVLATYQARVDNDPSQAEHWLQLAHFLTTLQRLTDALSTLNRASSYLPFEPAILLAAGDAAYECQQYALAQRRYQRLVKLQPSNSQALFCLALTQEALGQVDEAQQTYEELLAQDPDWVPAYHNLGTLYMQHGAFQQAIRLFWALKRRFPHYRQAELGLAMAYDYAGQPDRSLRMYRRLVAHGGTEFGNNPH